MSDFSFMKTGFSNLAEPEGVSEDFMIQIGGLIMAFMKNGVKIAAKYVEHSGRDGITPDDIKRALQLEVFQFSKRDDTPKNIEDTIEWLKSDVEEYGSLGERDCEMPEAASDYLTDGLDIAKAEPTCEFAPSTCTCTTCVQMNAVNTLWEHWKPSTMLEVVLKKGIDKISTTMS